MSHSQCLAGPAAYSLPAAEVAQAPMIGERLDRDMRPVTPAPNKYQLPSSIRPASASGKSIGVRREIKSAHVTPPPNVYTISRPQTASAHFTYRTFPGKSNCTITCFPFVWSFRGHFLQVSKGLDQSMNRVWPGCPLHQSIAVEHNVSQCTQMYCSTLKMVSIFIVCKVNLSLE